MSDRLLKESDVIGAFKGRESLIHDVYTATAIIRSVPSADRPSGWVNARDGYDGHVKCASCFKTYDWDSQAQYYNFCPNCGADMRGADDE